MHPIRLRVIRPQKESPALGGAREVVGVLNQAIRCSSTSLQFAM